MAISQSIIDALKKEYGKIFLASYNNNEYIFRPLTLNEFYTVSGKHSSDELDDVVKAIIVYPENIDLDRLPAGFSTAMLDQSMEKSGYSDLQKAKKILEDARDDATRLLEMMKTFVLAARPTVDPDSLDDLTFFGLCKEVARAEKILEILSNNSNPAIDSVTVSIPDPVAEAEEAANRDPIAERLAAAMSQMG